MSAPPETAGQTVRSQACRFCGTPVLARKPTGRPPLYCWDNGKDCQAQAKLQRAASRAVDLTGGEAVTLRQTAADLAEQLDDAWEPVNGLLEAMTAARTALDAVEERLIARAEAAEAEARSAIEERDRALDKAHAAELTRDEALRQAAESRAAETAALKTRDAAEQARAEAYTARDRMQAQRDTAEQQAADAAAREAATAQAADTRVALAHEQAASAREKAAHLTAELAALRQQLDDEQQRAEADRQSFSSRLDQERAARLEEVEQIRRDQVGELAAQKSAYDASLSALVAGHENRALHHGEQLQALRAQTEREAAHRQRLLDVLGAVRAALASPVEAPAPDNRIEAALAALADQDGPLP